MLYTSPLLRSDYINNAGNASVQHNEIIFLMSADSYGNSLATRPRHQPWPQITAVLKTPGPFCKVARRMGHGGGDGRHTVPALMLEGIINSFHAEEAKHYLWMCHNETQ